MEQARLGAFPLLIGGTGGKVKPPEKIYRCTLIKHSRRVLDDGPVPVRGANRGPISGDFILPNSERNAPLASVRNRLGFSSLSLWSQLLLAINVPLVVLVSLFLGYDFRREMADRAHEKQVTLDEEAKTILPAVLEIRHHGDHHVQRYIDTVCARMRDADSPGHHIAVVLPGGVMQAKAHDRASSKVFEAMQLAASTPKARAKVGDREIIVGSAGKGYVAVYVSEEMSHLRRSVRNDVLRRIVGLLILAIFAAIIVNLVLLRLVSDPLTRLVAAVREIAAGKLGIRMEPLSSAELRFLSNEINAMSGALAAADKYRVIQMEKAREIQQHVLPTGREIPGLAIASVFQPADEIGGDYYDIIPMPDGKVLLCVADVTGHGVSAAMSTMLLRTLLHTGAELHPGSTEILAFVNQRFVEATLPGDFATVILVQLDLRTRHLEYVNAGHETGWLLSQSGQHRALESTGLVLGIDEKAAFASRECIFEPGDRLVLVTDGVTEAQGLDGKLFGRKRLIELLQESSHLPLHDVTARLNEALVQFRNGTPSHDDVTVLLATVRADGVRTVSAS